MTRREGRLVGLIALVILAIPLIFWGGHYLANGDESKLYYLYPWEYLQRFSPQLISDNSLGTLGFYSPRADTLLFVGLIGILKSSLPFVNTQLLSYGLNLAGSFVASYLLLGLWVTGERASGRWLKLVAALGYTFSAFAFYTLWFNQLFAIYLASSFPLVLWLFLRGIRDQRPQLVVLAALVSTLFSVTLLAIPWLVALVLAALPLVVIASWSNWRRLVGYGALFVALVGLLNTFWLAHFLYSPVSSDQGSNDFISRTNAQSFRDENERLITLVTNQQSTVQPLLNAFHGPLQEEFDWRTRSIYDQWHRPWLAAGTLFALVVALAALSLDRANRRLQTFYLAALFSWLGLLYLFTVRIGSWGQPLFLWLSDHVPGFVMFRNPYDKFSLALALSWMSVLAASLAVLSETSRRWLSGTFIGLVALLSLIIAQPMIRGSFFTTPLRTTERTVESIHGLNPDFTQLTSAVRQLNPAERILWLPMNEASYVQISSDEPNHVYSGISPLFFLTGVGDLTGRLSVPPAVGDQLTRHLLAGDGDSVGRLLQPYAVGSVIVNHDVSTDLATSYLFTVNRPGDLLTGQNETFRAALLGPKLADFGARYSLYAINPAYRRPRLYLADDLVTLQPTDQPFEFEKVSSSRYRLRIDRLSQPTTLVFLDPYHERWQLRSRATGQRLVTGPHGRPFDDANSWVLDPSTLTASANVGSVTRHSDGSLQLDLELTFQPADLAWIGYAVSGFGGLLAISWLITTWRVSQRRSLV